jgi:ribosomal protein S6
MDEINKKLYEVAMWIDLNLEGKVDEQGLKIAREKLTQLGAEILSESIPKVSSIAYPIKKKREGAFVVFNVSMDPKMANSIIPSFSYENKILRVSVGVKTASPLQKFSPSYQKPQPQKTVNIEKLDEKLEEILAENK